MHVANKRRRQPNLDESAGGRRAGESRDNTTVPNPRGSSIDCPTKMGKTALLLALLRQAAIVPDQGSVSVSSIDHSLAFFSTCDLQPFAFSLFSARLHYAQSYTLCILILLFYAIFCTFLQSYFGLHGLGRDGLTILGFVGRFIPNHGR